MIAFQASSYLAYCLLAMRYATPWIALLLLLSPVFTFLGINILIIFTFVCVYVSTWEHFKTLKETNTDLEPGHLECT